MQEKGGIQNKLANFGKKNRRSSDLSSYVFDKIQPQAVDMEEAVLGAMMLDKDAVSNVIDILKANSFYLDAHQKIYKCFQELFLKNKPIDLLTVTEQLRKTGELEAVGGPFYITQLASRVGSSANVEHHARVVAEKFILRELIRSSNQVIKNAYDETTDVFELLDRTEQSLFEITDQNLRRNYDTMGNLVNQAIKQIEEIGKNKEGVIGIPSGFTALDRITSGWQKSDLVILAARPGMGKTAFTLNLARNAAVDYNKPVAFFSLEMSSLQLVNRLISSEAELSGEKLKKGDLERYEWEQLNSKVQKLSEAPIFIDDTPGLNIFELRAKCRRLKMQHDIQMVMIDYLQLMSGTGDKKGGNREQEISQISRALKGIAKELNIPVIALSQLSRAVETRGGNKKPQLSDLRESGAIEQDADMVIFLYRPEYYGFDQDDEGNPTQGIGEVIIAKHRNGALDTVKARFIAKFAKFADLDLMSGANIDGYVPMNQIITKTSRMNEGGNSLPPGMGGPPPPSVDDNDIPF